MLYIVYRCVKNKNKSSEKKERTPEKEVDAYYTKEKIITEKKSTTIMMIIDSIIALLYILPIIFSSFSGSFNKAELLSNSNGIISYYKMITAFLTIYIFTQNEIKYKKIYYIIIIFLMSLTLLLGHRSFFVIAAIAIIITLINKQSENTNNLLMIFKKNWKKICIIVLLFLIFMFTKNIYTSVFNGNFNAVSKRLTDSTYYINSFKISEFNTIFTNLDTVVEKEYSYPIENYLLRTSLVAIPFASRRINITPFSTQYQQELFGVNNRASTFIGEAYASGGNILLTIILIVVILLINLLDKKNNKTKNNILKTFFLISATDLSFYIHRNSLEYELSRIRSYFYITILFLIINFIIYEITKGKTKNEK